MSGDMVPGGKKSGSGGGGGGGGGDSEVGVFKLDTNFSIYVEMARQLRAAGWAQCSGGSKRYHVLLGDRFQINYATDLLGREVVGCQQLVNYFPKTHEITLKAAMLRRIREEAAVRCPGNPVLPAWLPESYILMKSPSALGGEGAAAAAAATAAEDASLPPWKRSRKASAAAAAAKLAAEALAERAAMLRREEEEDGGKRRRWIVKPSSGCGGQGIAIAEGAAEAAAAVDSLEGGTARTVYVAQEYLGRPLLLGGGRKFDVRAWALLTAPFDVWLFSEGSLRTACRAYKPDDVTDMAVHITNHCLQEKEEGYGAHEEGNEMWYDAFDEYLAGQGRPSLAERILPQFRRIVTETLLCMKDRLQVDTEHSSFVPFQLFGFDFLIDDDLKVWLLELNGSPASAERWKEPMVADILRKTVGKSFAVPGLSGGESQPQEQTAGPRFELVYSSNTEE